MEDFLKEYSILNGIPKREFSVNEFSFSKKGFDIVITSSDMRKITKEDIVVFNHRSKQYRTFKYESCNDKDGMIFKCGEITLTIRKG